ncbi:MAG TPA: sulfatase [Prosthecobacter sp.]|nr:sulfatase [Prosthecobacter sp.]
MPLPKVCRPLIAFAVVLLSGQVATAGAAPPNVVWIIADDMSPDTGAYGHEGVRTPHLDRLAAEGVRYSRAYASAPVCSSSRSAFILGCYQTTTGLHAHEVENPQPLAAPYQPLPELLRKAGYFVTNASAPGDPAKKRKGKTHYNFAHDANEMYDGDDWRQRKPGQPFFAQFQIYQPHRPFPIPEEFEEAALRELKLPANYPDHPLMRRDWYAYLRSVEIVDRRVGLVLAELETAGELDNTIVMFFADHGRAMPWGKQWLTAEGLRVPLIIRGPGVAAVVEERLVSLIDLAPTVLRLAGLMAPSWMEGRAILGAAFPDRSEIFAARDRCGDAQDRIRAVITHDELFVRNFQPELPYLNWSSYKEGSYPSMPLLRELNRLGALNPLQARYLADHKPAVELYDLKADPTGVYDVAEKPENARRITEKQAVLTRWIESTGDRGALPDPPTEPTLAEMQRGKRKGYHAVWEKRGLPSEPTDAERLKWWLKNYRLPVSETAP